MTAPRLEAEPKAPPLEFGFDFDVKADALYKLVMPKLRQVGATDGFELFRRLTQKLDPTRADSAFHLANEIRGLGVAPFAMISSD